MKEHPSMRKTIQCNTVNVILRLVIGLIALYSKSVGTMVLEQILPEWFALESQLYNAIDMMTFGHW